MPISSIPTKILSASGYDKHDPSEPWSIVAGVAAEVKNSGLSKDEVPEYYRLRRDIAGDWGQGGSRDRTSVLAVRSSLPAGQTAGRTRSAVAALDPTLPIDLATLLQRVSKFADQPGFQTLPVGFFAATGLALAWIGLYGVICFWLTQRTQKIGVLMALGASKSDILRLVMGESLRLIAAGTVIGLISALAATLVPARSASCVNPIVALRCD